MDEDGYVTLQDRSKDMIISGGSNIYPREVEEVLLTHPSVKEVAVVGRPHDEWGEEVGSNTIEVHIHHLRKKFPKEFIKTLRGIGYVVGKR